MHCLLGVIRIHPLQALVIKLGGRSQDVPRGRVEALENALADGVPVDGEIDRLAHPHVVSRRVLSIEPQRAREPRLDGPDNLVVGVLAETVCLGRRHFVDGIRFSGLKRPEPRLVFQDKAEIQVVEIGGSLVHERRRPVVVGVLDQLDLVAVDLAHEFERAGADQVLVELLAVLLRGIRRDNRDEVRRQREREERIGFLEGHPDRVRIDDFGLLVGTEQWPGHLGAGGLIDHAIEIELQRLGVERGAVVEFHILAQFQRPGFEIARRFPRGGQAGDVLERIRVDIDQPVEDVDKHVGRLVEVADVRIEGIIVDVADPDRQRAA